MDAEVLDPVICQHCPEILKQDDSGQWVDSQGYNACQHGQIISHGKACSHSPMPAGLRGSAPAH